MGKGRALTGSGLCCRRIGKDFHITFSTRHYLIFFILVLFQASSCGSSGSGGSREERVFDSATLESLFAAADDGDYSGLEEAGRSGGEGAWYVLAAAAFDAGNDDIADYARIRSVEEDPHPFGTRSLALLLAEEPDGLRRPLGRLNKAVRDYGEDAYLRAARIAVLNDLGKKRALVDEYSAFTGSAFEAPVLAAALELLTDNPSVGFTAANYVLYVSNPSVPADLPVDRLAFLGAGISDLARARMAFAEGDYDSALDGYRRWLTAVRSVSAGGGNTSAAGTGTLVLPENYDYPPPVFAEIAEAAGKTDSTREWADRLTAAAVDLPGILGFSAAFEAGKLRRLLGDYDLAAEDFLFAAQLVDPGLQRDRAFWYALRVSYQLPYLSAEDEMNLWETVWSGWEKPERFDDQLEVYIHRLLRSGNWSRLESLAQQKAGEWPSSVQAHLSLILAFAASENRLTGTRAAGDYLEDAYSADALSWAGLRAAGLLNRDIEIPDEPLSDGIAEAESFEDAAIRLFLKWGLVSLAYRRVMETPDAYSVGTLRAVSRALAPDTPRLSIRVAGLLWKIEGYSPGREDFLLRYPLPFGDMAAEYALREGIPVDLFHGLIRTESAWDAWALSRSGAMGLAQFMPATWDEWVRRMKYPENTDPTDPEANAALGAAYLAWLYNREWTYGWIEALASYNAGGAWVRSWRQEIPRYGDDLFGENIPVEEPRSYIRKVLSAATIYGYLYSGSSPALLHRSWGLDMIEVE